MAQKVKTITMKISVKLRDLIVAQKMLLDRDLRQMGVNKTVSKVVASDILAKRVKKKLK
jgi:hypothetical protein